MTHDDLHARHDRDLLIRTLQELGAKFRGSSCTCPFHDDNSASGTVYERDNIWRYRCHAVSCAVGGDVFDIRARVSGRDVAAEIRAWRQEQPQTPQHTPKPQNAAQRPPQARSNGFPDLQAYIDWMDRSHRMEHVTTYRYTRDGADILLVLKFIDPAGKKSFRQVHWNGTEIIPKCPTGTPIPLYNLKNIIDAKTVLVVEGEKCVFLAHQHGIPCTTSAMGAGKAAHTDWSPLAGKNVVLWPDHDDPDPKTGIAAGMLHMQEVAKILERLDPTPTVHILDPAGLDLPRKASGKGGADLEQYLDAIPEELRRQAIIDAMGDAKICGPAAEVRDRLEARISGRHIGIPWPMYQFSNITNALLPGTVTLCCGDPGCSKSFFLLQAAASWHSQYELPVALYELEDDRAFHLERALVQACHEPQIFDATWCTGNGPLVRQHYQRYEKFLNDFGKCIWEAPESQVTLPALADWVEERCNEGRQIIVIDPITAADSGQSPWLTEKEFIFRVKAALRRSGARLVLVTHPKAGGKGLKTGLDQLAGSENYRRFAHTIFWIKHYPELINATIACSRGDFEAMINREFHIGKARLGKGQGLTVGAIFETHSMSFSEVGLLRHRAAPSRRPENKEEPRTLNNFSATEDDPKPAEQEALF